MLRARVHISADQVFGVCKVSLFLFVLQLSIPSYDCFL